MQALRSLILWLLVLSITAGFCLFLLPFALLRRQRFIFRVARVWATLLLWIAGIRVIVEHADRLLPPDGSAAILLANHQSFLDVVAFCFVLPAPVAYMAKASLFRIPIFGQVLRGIGCIPIERENRGSGGASMREAVAIIRSGRRIMVFPEGTRSRADGTLMPFKRGGFLLAKKSAVPIQALTVSGAGRIMPAGQRGVWIQRIYSGTIRVVVHPVLAPESFADLSTEDLSQQIYRWIDRPLDRLSVLAELETNRM